MSIEELIGKLEQATGPDRELADEVLLACGWTVDHEDHEGVIWRATNGDLIAGDHNPLASLDSALTLVPEGHMHAIAGPWRYSEHHHDRDLWGKPIWYAAVSDELHGVDVESLDDFDHSGKGPTPAIALCIAALKARTSMESNHDL